MLYFPIYLRGTTKNILYYISYGSSTLYIRCVSLYIAKRCELINCMEKIFMKHFTAENSSSNILYVCSIVQVLQYIFYTNQILSVYCCLCVNSLCSYFYYIDCGSAEVYKDMYPRDVARLVIIFSCYLIRILSLCNRVRSLFPQW